MNDISKWSFASDANKMHDFIVMGMEAFMNSYSYLTEEDYYATYNEVMSMLKEKYPNMEIERV